MNHTKFQPSSSKRLEKIPCLKLETRQTTDDRRHDRRQPRLKNYSPRRNFNSVVDKNNPCLPYTINGALIDSVEKEKDIGFWITDDLSTSTHVHKARSKALGEISRIRRNFTLINKRAFCILYNQRVRPHLDQGMAACPPNTAAESKMLEGVQSKATALVHGLKHLNSEERRKRLGLMKLEERREREETVLRSSEF